MVWFFVTLDKDKLSWLITRPRYQAVFEKQWLLVISLQRTHTSKTAKLYQKFNVLLSSGSKRRRKHSPANGFFLLNDISLGLWYYLASGAKPGSLRVSSAVGWVTVSSVVGWVTVSSAVGWVTVSSVVGWVTVSSAVGWVTVSVPPSACCCVVLPSVCCCAALPWDCTNFGRYT